MIFDAFQGEALNDCCKALSEIWGRTWGKGDNFVNLLESSQELRREPYLFTGDKRKKERTELAGIVIRQQVKVPSGPRALWW
jgi:hypothetical protein